MCIARFLDYFYFYCTSRELHFCVVCKSFFSVVFLKSRSCVTFTFRIILLFNARVKLHRELEIRMTRDPV